MLRSKTKINNVFLFNQLFFSSQLFSLPLCDGFSWGDVSMFHDYESELY